MLCADRTGSSIGVPSTSMMRPSVALPTGTEIGAPVFLAIRLRLRPSVEPSAIVRTMPSPSCCCTSSVIAVSTFSASYTAARVAREFDVDDCADDLDDLALVPWLRFSCPSRCPLIQFDRACRSSDRGGAADDFGDFLRDRRLAGLVVDQLQLSITLLALSEAAFIATMRAAVRRPCSRAPPGTPATRRSASAPARARSRASGS